MGAGGGLSSGIITIGGGGGGGGGGGISAILLLLFQKVLSVQWQSAQGASLYSNICLSRDGVSHSSLVSFIYERASHSNTLAFLTAYDVPYAVPIHIKNLVRPTSINWTPREGHALSKGDFFISRCFGREFGDVKSMEH